MKITDVRFTKVEMEALCGLSNIVISCGGEDYFFENSIEKIVELIAYSARSENSAIKSATAKVCSVLTSDSLFVFQFFGLRINELEFS